MVAGVLALCLIGACVAAVGAAAFLRDRDDSSGGAAAPMPTTTFGYETTEPSDDETDPSDDDDTDPEPTQTTESPPPPPPAKIGQCIVVNEEGDFLGIGNCNGSRGTYRVVSVDYSQGDCADPESAYITEDGYRLCLELHLVRNYCYKFPKGDGWVVGAVKCKAKGTVHVIDIVPGGANGDRCTQEYQWNRWYRFLHPTVVYCVMEY